MTQRISDVEFGNNTRKRALIVVGMQNCYFNKGSFAMIASDNIDNDIKKEITLLDRINSLINLNELDPDYFKAGLAGSAVFSKTGFEKKSDIDSGLEYLNGTYPSGSRKKYYFDKIVYTQTVNPPDHFSLSSHHYLRAKKGTIKSIMEDQGLDYPSAVEKVDDSQLDYYYWAYVNSKYENIGMRQFDKKGNKLWSDHALSDGSDVIKENSRCYRGVDFHPRLSLMPLYRPNQELNLHESVFINQPKYNTRGSIVSMYGDDKSAPRSAFYNSSEESTGLDQYLKDNQIEDLYIVGMFRDIAVEITCLDAIKAGYKNVNLMYDVSLPYGLPENNTGVNKEYYFKNEEEMNKYIETIGEIDKDTKYDDYLKAYNQWGLELEKKGVNIINYMNILENTKPVNNILSCNLNKGDMIKNLDNIFLSYTGDTSRD